MFSEPGTSVCVVSSPLTDGALRLLSDTGELSGEQVSKSNKLETQRDGGSMGGRRGCITVKIGYKRRPS